MDLNALLRAADTGDVEAVEAALDAGVDIDAADGKGWTALLTAARAAQGAVVLALLKRSADVRPTRPGGFGPLHLLIQEARDNGLKPNHLELAALLLDAGADPNQATDGEKQTPVRNAAALGFSPLLKLFLGTARVDLNLRDKGKGTALMRACETNQRLCALMLIDVGADPTIGDRYGLTPLHAAAFAGDVVLVDSLLRAGADPTAATRFPYERFRAKTTPLMVAERLGHTPVIERLTAPPEAEEDAPGPWPDADSADAAWIRDVLTGKAHVPGTRDGRHVLDDLRALRYDPEQKARLDTGFRGLLIDADPKVRAAAVQHYTSAPDDGAVLRAWREHLPLYTGVEEPWYPGDTDLRGLLASVLSRYALSSDEARDLVREEAVIRGRGATVIAGLVAADRLWLLNNIEPIVNASPDALYVLLASARIRNLDPEAIMRRLIGRVDEGILIAAIREALPKWREWLDGVVAKAQADTSLDVEAEEDDYLAESRAMLGKLLDYDSAEVMGKLDAMLDASPALGEALILEMAARHMDLRGVVIAMRDRVDRDTLKAWLQQAVDDELQLLVYMAMI